MKIARFNRFSHAYKSRWKNSRLALVCSIRDDGWSIIRKRLLRLPDGRLYVHGEVMELTDDEMRGLVSMYVKTLNELREKGLLEPSDGPVEIKGGLRDV